MGKRRKKPQESIGEMDISSLIDVSFLLLFYFLVSSSLIETENDLKMNIPSSAPPTSEGPSIEPLYITIRPNGDIYEGDQLLDRYIGFEVPLLSSRLEFYNASAKATGEEPTVQIEVSMAAENQSFMNVLNALAGEQISQISVLGVQ